MLKSLKTHSESEINLIRASSDEIGQVEEAAISIMLSARARPMPRH